MGPLIGVSITGMFFTLWLLVVAVIFAAVLAMMIWKRKK